MFIIRNRSIFFALTGALVAFALAALIIFGLRFSIDFTGGTLVQVTYPQGRPPASALQKSLDAAGFSNYSLREASANDYILRAGNMTVVQRQALPETLSASGAYPATIDQQNEIGPSIGAELRSKAVLSIGVVMLCILLFIAFAFRKVSKPVSSWVYGLVALITLIHDVIIPVGFFAILGHFAGASVDTLFVTAVLTVLGFSVHDTIVVFDRVRENLRLNQERNKKEDFADTAGRSLNQTFVRSINTSLTVVITLLVLFFLGPASTRDFALTLLVGIVAGTYSSIFLATPLLVTIESYRRKRK
jgi:preprotein translocase subunit SecF